MDQTKCYEGGGQGIDKLLYLVDADVIRLNISCCHL